MSNRKTKYITSDEIYEEWIKWRDSAEAVEDRVVSEKMGEYMRRVAEKILNGPKFSRYPESMKEDMVQDAIYKIMVNLKNMKEERRDGFFNYWTCCCFSSNMNYLRKHYRQMNIRRNAMKRQLEELQSENPSLVDQNMLKQLKEAIQEFEHNNNTTTEED